MRVDIPAFSKGPVTFAAIFTYLLIFFLISWTDDLPNVPKNQKGLNLQDAYNDLHHIAARPHPYNSHANDHIRAFILDKVHSIASEFPHVQVVNDLRSNGSWTKGDYGVYFEGSNILVKIDGTDSQYRDKGGVLFSAHFDSVSTAPGATDDGMGVATTITLIQYFARHRPQRTAIFNINNGEEDGLHGAYAFLRHPWSKIPESFLNLEGAAAGGRPILFRVTSSAILRAFKGKYVPHPHANVVSADIFSRGAIRSESDYSVYVKGAQMQGLELAFYKGRSMYHTKYDATPYTNGQEKSLWSMMEAARGAGSALLNDSKTHDPEEYVPAVYFDLFGSSLVLFSLDSLYLFNILFLILSPLILAGLLFVKSIIKAHHRHSPGIHPHHTQPLLTRILTDSGLMWRWAKFWVAILLTVGVQASLIFIFVKTNPFVIYSHPYVVLFLFAVTAYNTLIWTITFDLPSPQDEVECVPESQKETILLQSYSLSWAFLLLSTIAIGTAGVGGFYFVTYWSVGLWLSCGITVLQTVFSVCVMDDGRSHSQPASRDGDHAGPSERTPLMGDRHTDNGHGNEDRAQPRKSDVQHGLAGWWLLQFLLVVPVPVIMVTHISNMLLDATSQTLGDGNSKVVVYASASLMAFLLVLPLAPFSFRLHRSIRWVLLFTLVFVMLWATLWTFPFDSENPLPVFFQQRIELEGSVVSIQSNYTRPNIINLMDTDTQAQRVVKDAMTTLTGVGGYLRDDIIPKLPSANGKQIGCSKSKHMEGLLGCTWSSGYEMLPQPGSALLSNPAGSSEDTPGDGVPPFRAVNRHSFFRATTNRTSPTSAQFTIQGKNTRNCRIYFENRPIIHYTVHGSSPDTQPHYEIRSTGIKELRLWSRTWDKAFVVDVEWRDYLGRGDGLKGRLGCEWAEYASASAGLPMEGDDRNKGGFRSAKIPALEEALSFLPPWVAVSKSGDGLVEAWERFEV